MSCLPLAGPRGWENDTNEGLPVISPFARDLSVPDTMMRSRNYYCRTFYNFCMWSLTFYFESIQQNPCQNTFTFEERMRAELFAGVIYSTVCWMLNLAFLWDLMEFSWFVGVKVISDFLLKFIWRKGSRHKYAGFKEVFKSLNSCFHKFRS